MIPSVILKKTSRSLLGIGLAVGLISSSGGVIAPADAGEVSRKALEEERNPPSRGGRNVSAGGPNAGGAGEVSRKALEDERNPVGSRKTGSSAGGARLADPDEVSRKALEDERNPPGSK